MATPPFPWATGQLTTGRFVWPNVQAHALYIMRKQFRLNWNDVAHIFGAAYGNFRRAKYFGDTLRTGMAGGNGKARVWSDGTLPPPWTPQQLTDRQTAIADIRRTAALLNIPLGPLLPIQAAGGAPGPAPGPAAASIPAAFPVPVAPIAVPVFPLPATQPHIPTPTIPPLTHHGSAQGTVAQVPSMQSTIQLPQSSDTQLTWPSGRPKRSTTGTSTKLLPSPAEAPQPKRARHKKSQDAQEEGEEGEETSLNTNHPPQQMPEPPLTRLGLLLVQRGMSGAQISAAIAAEAQRRQARREEATGTGRAWLRGQRAPRTFNPLDTVAMMPPSRYGALATVDAYDIPRTLFRSPSPPAQNLRRSRRTRSQGSDEDQGPDHEYPQERYDEDVGDDDYDFSDEPRPVVHSRGEPVRGNPRAAAMMEEQRRIDCERRERAEAEGIDEEQLDLSPPRMMGSPRRDRQADLDSAWVSPPRPFWPPSSSTNLYTFSSDAVEDAEEEMEGLEWR